MAKLSGIVRRLKKEGARVEREVSGLNAAVGAFVNAYAGKAKPKPTSKRRKAKASARKKSSAAPRARRTKARKSKA